MHQEKIVFVLWADRFDETMAALFVAELRKAGVRVKLVSLTGQPSPGAYGVSLVPDLTLEQALPLAKYAGAVIIPCGASGLSRLRNDPRVQSFFSQASRGGAKFVVGQAGMTDLESFHWPDSAMPPMIGYADGQEAILMVSQVVESLDAIPPAASAMDYS